MEIEDEYVEGYLDRQLDFYVHLQQRAERLIQLLIASAAVIVTFGSSGVVSNIISVLGEFPSSTGANNFFIISNNSEIIFEFVPPLTVIYLAIGLFLIIDCVIWAFGVLNMDELRPHLELPRSESDYRFWIDYDKLDEIFENREKHPRNNIKREIERNKIIISAMRKGLKSSYFTLVIGFVSLILAVLLPIFEILGDATPILITGLGLFMLQTIVIIGLLVDLGHSLITDEETKSTSEVLYEKILELYKTPHMIVLFPFAILIFYSYITGISITLIWLSQTL